MKIESQKREIESQKDQLAAMVRNIQKEKEEIEALMEQRKRESLRSVRTIFFIN